MNGGNIDIAQSRAVKQKKRPGNRTRNATRLSLVIDRKE